MEPIKTLDNAESNVPVLPPKPSKQLHLIVLMLRKTIKKK